MVEVATTASPTLLSFGALFVIPKILAGALRWHFLVKRFQCSTLRLPSSVREYWLSLTVGLVLPGSLGSDAYRVALCGRQTGRYLRGALVLVIEKVAALLSCAVLITLLYPSLPFVSIPSVVGHLMDIIHGFLIVTAVSTALVLAVRRTQLTRCGLAYIGKRITAIAASVQRWVEHRQRLKSTAADAAPIGQLLQDFGVGAAGTTLALSVTIHVIAAIQNQVFFQAFGHDLPIVINLFVSPLMMLLFALPITVGGIGIREGAFIIVYGAFGVPPETALLIAFAGLASVLLGHAGGVILLLRRPNKVDDKTTLHDDLP